MRGEALPFRKLVSKPLATARANSVLPVPGGPYSRTPFGGLMPTRIKSSGFFSGSSITSLSSRICSFSPPMPENDTCPGSSSDMLYTSGSTSRGSMRIIVRVVMSRATRVPCLSFTLSTLERQPTTYRGPEDALTMTSRSSVYLVLFAGVIECTHISLHPAVSVPRR